MSVTETNGSGVWEEGHPMASAFSAFVMVVSCAKEVTQERNALKSTENELRGLVEEHGTVLHAPEGQVFSIVYPDIASGEPQDVSHLRWDSDKQAGADVVDTGSEFIAGKIILNTETGHPWAISTDEQTCVEFHDFAEVELKEPVAV